MSVSTIEQTTRHAVVDSPLGPLSVVRDDEGITGIWFPGHWTRPDRSAFGPEVDPADDRGFDEVTRQLGEYFAGTRRSFDLPLHVSGDETTEHVWGLLTRIPYGKTTTYGTLAREVGDVNPQAIGSMVGHNPLSVVVPCHRVVGSDGKLVGYAGGLGRKRWLLEHEGALPPTLW
jgi:methylated-DNA-[protein]-cysteine S-methyltransferase